MPVEPQTISTRAFVSLSQLAEDILGISRARLYELIERGAMPQPLYDLRTRRPIFNAELQRQALTVRQTGVAIDGSAVIWYRRDRISQPTTPATSPAIAGGRRRGSTPQPNRHADLVSSLQGLGVATADDASVSAAVAECFPSGIDGQQDADVLRQFFFAICGVEKVPDCWNDLARVPPAVRSQAARKSSRRRRDAVLIL